MELGNHRRAWVHFNSKSSAGFEAAECHNLIDIFRRWLYSLEKRLKRPMKEESRDGVCEHLGEGR